MWRLGTQAGNPDSDRKYDRDYAGSVADNDELFYTVKQPDGTLQSYIYNVTNGQNTRVFDTNPFAPR